MRRFAIFAAAVTGIAVMLSPSQLVTSALVKRAQAIEPKITM